MEQQLLEKIIQITPETMDDTLIKIQTILAGTNDTQLIMDNIIKSLFFGLWNFDKMINQHNLNLKISELLIKLPKKTSLLFFRAMLKYLQQKWNLIDHHRINKFMQLVRYLIGQSLKLVQKSKMKKEKVDKIIVEEIFDKANMQNGLTYHILDIYYKVCQQNFSQVRLEELSLFQNVLTTNTNEHLRLYIISHVYEQYKRKILENQTNIEQLEVKIQQFATYFMELAKRQQKQSHRKNLYSIVGFAKSQQLSYDSYMMEKKQKAKAQQEKRRKTITKSKKKEIKKLKEKRKQKKKKGKKMGKILSVRKFEDKNNAKRGIQQL